MQGTLGRSERLREDSVSWGVAVDGQERQGVGQARPCQRIGGVEDEGLPEPLGALPQAGFRPRRA
jgi:hypothetical protein